MLTVRDILFGVVAPAVISTLAMLIAAGVWRLLRKSAKPEWAGPVAVCLAFSLSYAFVFGRPEFPPPDVTDWLFYFPFVLAVVGVIEGSWRLPRGIQYALTLAATAGAITLLLRPLCQNTWTTAESLGWIAGLAIYLAVSVIALEVVSDRARGSTLPLALFVATGLAALVLMLSGSQKLGQMGGILTLSIGPVLLWGWWTNGPLLSKGTVLIYVILYGALLFASRFYAELTAWNAVLLALVPVFAAVCLLSPLRRLPPWKTNIAQGLFVVTPATIAFILAVIEFQRTVGEYGQ